MSKKRDQSVCPISKGLDLFGDKWTLLIVRDMFAGKTTYGEFLASPEGVSTNILANRLHLMVAEGLAEKSVSTTVQNSFTYVLTPKGKQLYSVIDAISDWSLTYIEGTKKLVPVRPPQED